MLLEYKFKSSYTKAEVDKLLKEGWFRSTELMVKAHLMCLDKKVSAIINIRLPLKNFTLKKKHKKIIKKVENKFHIEINNCFIDDEKEKLYHLFKKRLHGFICYNLEDFLFGSAYESIFDTREIAVYDQNKLIAVSYFDQGKKSIASLLCFYDLDYMKYSLGTYTMLKEIEYAVSEGYKYYYPGFLLHNNPCYDYKLTPGSMQYQNNNNQWVKLKDEIDPFFYISFIDKLTNIENELIKKNISYKRKLNPYYAYGYISLIPDKLLKCIVAFFINTKISHNICIIEYDPDVNVYMLREVCHAEEYDDLKNAYDSSYYTHDDIYLTELYMYSGIVYKSSSIAELVDEFIIPLMK